MEDEDRIADKSDLEIKLVPNLVPPRGGDSVCNDVWLASRSARLSRPGLVLPSETEDREVVEAVDG
ncbi:hypothetical protein C0Q70_17068 [Pomacea canaliculata]|uniref:Uncharacterized protein n=1 Tax=Pomacea canaliculata TaxID=400727 RepID=A0A2T7NRJ3_POMCA|nr:hypothetical protein C0Q70_17068 [Pomacea canaliculata]